MPTRRYRYRVYLTPEQERAATRLFGCVRIVWNTALYARNVYFAEHGKSMPDALATLGKNLTAMKRTPEYAFLRDVSVAPLQQALRDQDQAFANYFASRKRKRKGPEVRLPQFKRRHFAPSARFTRAHEFASRQLNAKWSTIYLPKIGHVKFRRSRDLPSAPGSVTLTRSNAGTYHISFVVRTASAAPSPLPDVACGIHLGVNNFAAIVSSDGRRQKISSPRFLRQRERKLRALRRALSRKQEDSKRRYRTSRKLARVYEDLRNQKQEFARALAQKLTRENQAVSVQMIDSANPVQRKTGSSTHLTGRWIFLIELEDAARKTGCTILRLDSAEPTAQRCSSCGSSQGLDHSDANQWLCPRCGANLDHDYNAALNIMVAAGLADTLNERGELVSRLALTDKAQCSLNR